MQHHKPFAIKRIYKYLLIFFLGYFVLLGSFYMLLQNSSVQTFLCQKIAAYLEEDLGAHISIGRVDYAFFNSLVLEDFLLEDQQQDTLAFVGELKLSLRFVNRDFTRINVNQVKLKDPYVNLYSIDSTHFNSSFLFSDADTSARKFKYLKLAGLNIENGRFRFHNLNYPDSINHVNYNHIDAVQINLKARAINIRDTTMRAFVEDLSLEEENGFSLQKLATHFKMDPHSMHFKALNIETAITNLTVDYSMQYQSMSDFANFIEAVEIESNFTDALIGVQDVAFFVPDLAGIDHRVYIYGKVNGTVDNLSGRKLRVSWDKETFVEGDFDMRGLPNFEETYMFFDLKEFKTNAKGLRNIPIPPFKENKHLSIADNFDQLGSITFSGEYAGFYNDFVAYGQFKSNLGDVRTDLSLKENERGKLAYSGEIFSQSFKIGKFIKFENLSEFGLDVKIKGEGLSFKEIKAKAEGQIDHFTLNGYRYSDVELNGEFTNQKFTGTLSLNDENLAFDFSGLIDASLKRPLSKFQFNLYHSQLAKLNLFQQNDSLTRLSLCAQFDLTGKNIDDVTGTAEITDLWFKDSRLEHRVDSIQLIATGSSESRNLDLRSDLLNGHISGAFVLEKIPETLLLYLEDYIPGTKSGKSFSSVQDFQFDFLLKNMNPLTEVFIPQLEIDSNMVIAGSINTESHVSTLGLSAVNIKFGAINSIRPELNLKSKSSSIQADFKSEQFQVNKIDLRMLEVNSSLVDGLSKTSLSWRGIGERADPGQINLETRFQTLRSLETSLHDSYFNLNDSTWSFSDSILIAIDSSSLRVKQFLVSNGNQVLAIDGGISEDLKDTMNLSLTNLDLAYVSQLIPDDLIVLEGTANGTASIQDVYHNFSLISNLRLDRLSINDIEIGGANLLSTWNPEKKALMVKANLGEKSDKVLGLKGVVYPLRKENSLDLTLNLTEFPILLFKPYLTDILSDLSGNIDGSIKINGKAIKPLLDGDLNIRDASFKIDYLNTRYSLSDKVFIRPDYIGFNLIQIKDENENVGIATGTLFHDNYADFNLDIGLEVKEFMALNTNSSQNELYYGKAIVTGDANISGYADQIALEINLKTEKGTDFSIPLSDGIDVSDSEFLEFTNSPKEYIQKSKIDLTGIQLNFDLDIQPEAKVQIIFDEQVGDIIKGQGQGKLKLEINTLGDFNIYGRYIVQQGDYLFTLQNVINKKFKIASGSRISWDGDPYAADIDIKAIYNLRASLYDLMPEDTTSNLRRRVPVELELQMTNQLLAPDINFDIRLPNSDENIKRRLESILYVNRNDVNQQEMNQQVFGLLVLNRFLPPTSGVASNTKYDRGTPGVNNGYEFLSNQLSNWLSKMSDQFDIGVNYRPGDEITSDELDLSLSTEVFNDRLVLDGNLGYVSNASAAETQNTTSFIGEFSAEYKLSRDGRFRVRGFNRSTNNNLLQNTSPYTQGVGFFYREEFDNFNELWSRYFRKANSKK